MTGLFFALVMAISLPRLASAVPPARVSEDGIWERLDAPPARHAQLQPWIRPAKARTFELRPGALQSLLARTYREFTKQAKDHPAVIRLPMPDGSYARFQIVESPVMEPELAAKYPEIRTYSGIGLDDPAATVRLDWVPAGFHAQILSPNGTVYIDPYSRGDSALHSSYYKRDYTKKADAWLCRTPGADSITTSDATASAAEGTANRSGPTLRTYRLACAANIEYTTFHGGTVAAGLAAVVTAINRVTGVYETELAIRLVLVANNDQLIFVSGNDGYTNNNGSTMLTENQTKCDSVIGSANYDIGHVFSTGGGGIAGLGVVCRAGLKAEGVTGSSSPTGDAFWIDYVAHEMGHQFGGNHTFNSTTSSCGGGNRNASTAYEPGSGSTIMAYAGICGSDDLQPHSDPYFHSVSFDEIVNYTRSGSGNGCAVQTSTGNTAPTVSAGSNYTIPANTPFTLTAAGSDLDGDPLTYCWEERDLGASQTLTAADNGASPLFRSFNPTNITSRTFPKYSAILNNTTSLGEKLPTTTRTMNFRVTARDNRAGAGGVNTADMSVSVTSAAGPFTVTFPNAAANLSGNITVTWNVANTASAPVSAANVKILLSTDGGNTFPAVLAASTPNDGSETVTLPNLTTSTARIRIEPVGNIFFDISNANFSITPATPTANVVADSTVLTAESCAPGNGAVDPDETVTVNLLLKNIGTANTGNLVATLQSTGGATSPSGPQNYGTVVAGGAAVSRSFTFTATGSCGGSVTATLQLQDGTTNLGTVTFNFTLGAGGAPVQADYSSGGVVVPIPDSGTVDVPLTVADVGSIQDVNVRLRANHTYDSDLVIDLIHPDGTLVNLVSGRGGSSDNFGSGATSCAGTFTVLDDSAATAISAGSAPFAGTYQPEQSLAALNGKPSNGTWKLRFTDTAAADTGTNYCWQLQITRQQTACCTGPVNFPPVISSATVVPGPNAFTDDSLTVTNIVATDAELEPVTVAYQWQFTTNGTAYVDQGGATTATLAATPGNSGKLWRCRLTPSDASGTGTNFFAGPVAVNNRPNLLSRHGQFYSYDSDLFLAGGGASFSRNAIINEFSQGANANKEWAEILFLKSTDARGWKLYDSNTGTVTFSNDSLWQNVPAGTLLVVYNGSDRDTTLPADDINIADRTLLIPHSNATYFSGAWPTISNNGDSLAISDATSTVIDGVSYGSNAGQTPQLGSVGAGTSASYTNDTEVGVDVAANWQIIASSSATPAAPNSLANSNLIATAIGGTAPLFRFATGSDLVPGLSIDPASGIISGIINAPGGGFYNLLLERYASSTIVTQQFALLVGDVNDVYTIPATKTWAINNNYTIAGTLIVQGTLDTAGYTLIVSNTLDVSAGNVNNTTGLIRYHKLISGPLPGASQQFNTLPVITATGITPANPADADDLFATVTGASDADGDMITFAFQWAESSDGMAFSDIPYFAATLPNTASAPGQYYRCRITPNDSIADGVPLTTAPVQVTGLLDSDNDGLPDAWEMTYFADLDQGANDDTDGDGHTNAQELAAGTNPNDASSVVRITAITQSGADVIVTFASVTGKSYELLRATNLPTAMWQTVGSATAAASSAQITDVGAVSLGQVFYRVRALP